MEKLTTSLVFARKVDAVGSSFDEAVCDAS